MMLKIKLIYLNVKLNLSSAQTALGWTFYNLGVSKSNKRENNGKVILVYLKNINSSSLISCHRTLNSPKRCRL